MVKIPPIKLKSGTDIPTIGFGTWQLSEGREAESSVSAALSAGYRLIDTAKIYGNEKGIGRAITASIVPRDEIFLTTKLWNSDHGYKNALRAFAESLQRLNMEYVDSYLIHWPGKDNAGSWEALIDIQKSGKAKTIGVSNFSAQQIQELIDVTGKKPSVNQIELHPFILEKQKETIDFCKKHQIIIEAYSPLSRGKNLDNKLLEKISQKYNQTSAQVVLRWSTQHGWIPIPKSAHPGRIKENLDIFSFELSAGDMEAIDTLGGTKTSLPFYVRLVK